MKRLAMIAAALLTLIATTAVTAAAPEGGPRLGINLAGPADWMTELPFVDVFRTARPWISQKQGAGWGQGPELAVDEFGWVKRLEPGCYAEAMLCTISGGHYPAGTYTVLYEGEGKVDFGKNAKIKQAEPGRILIDVDSSKGGFSLQLHSTNPQNPARNIHVIMPGFDQTWEKAPFHPAFLERWKGFACFRFMDWMHTNGSEISTWSQRPTLEHATFSKRGVALEWMIDLCNRHPRMGQLYARYFDEWARTGGDVFAVFSSIGRYSNHGAWGLAEFYDSRPSDYPKLDATLRWATDHGQPVSVE